MKSYLAQKTFDPILSLLPFVIDGFEGECKLSFLSFSSLIQRISAHSNACVKAREFVMPHFGKIKSYDSTTGLGTIAPDKGGEALAFAKANLQQLGQEPETDQRYAYETRQVVGGKAQAVNLKHQQDEREQTIVQQS